MDKSEKRASESNQARNDVLEDWYAAYRTPLLRYLASKVPPHAAEELVQEIFFNLLKVRDAELIRSPRAYLFRVAHNVLAEWHKRNRRIPLIDAELESLANEIPTDANSPEQQHQIKQVQRALDRLPPDPRAAIILHTNHGKTYDQIAEHLKISKRKVKRRIIEARAQLRRWLDDDTGGQS